MRSASRQAESALHEAQESAFTAAGSDLGDLAAELYSVASLLVAQPRLRRTLGDPATDSDTRGRFAESLFGGKIGQPALDLVAEAVRQRWSSPWDLTDALESMGNSALFAAAERDGALDTVEDELFRFERILQVEGDATALLDEAGTPAQRRLELLDALVAGKVSAPTLALLRHAVTSQRKRSVLLAIDDLLDEAAARTERSVARVLSAVALTDEQEQRLSDALTELYHRPISVRTAIDPDIRGGLVVRVGDEVIDGSIAARISAARTALLG